MVYKVGTGRKEVEIEVNTKVFKISFVSVYARKRASDLFSMVDRIEKILALEEPKRTEEYNKLTEEELGVVIQARSECIENLLVSNGHEYDADWWERFTGDAEQNEFIYHCLLKDSSKKKMASKPVK